VNASASALRPGRAFLTAASIVAYWGCIEHEVFEQTVLALPDGEEIPKKLNNIQFTEVFALWKELVIDPATGDRKAKLSRTLSRIQRTRSQVMIKA
jgi:hypothetical protein